MATWSEVSRDCLRAARVLAREGHARSSISRAYYAAYSAVTAVCVKQRVSFARGWSNPGHDQIPQLIAQSMRLPRDTRRQLSHYMRLLRQAREDSDYRPGISVDRTLVLNCIRLADQVGEALETADG